jgi:FdhE protein
MVEWETRTSDEIRTAARRLKTVRPVYAPLLDFHEAILIAQQAAAADIDLPPVRLPPEQLAANHRQYLPLLSMNDFSFDAAGGQALLDTVCRIIMAQNPGLAASAKTIRQSAAAGSLSAAALFRSLLAGDGKHFERIVADIGADKQTLAFVAYHSLRPYLVHRARQAADAYRPTDARWEKGYCPICGHPPVLGVLDSDGKRFLVCGFCWQPGSTARSFCPFCENTAAGTLHYLYTETEKDLRVDVCQKCRKYVKTVDVRQAGRRVCPPLEQIATLHLDMLARDQGYESPTAFLEIF